MIIPIVSSAIYLTNRQAVLEQLPQKLGALWKDWDLRLTVLLSLTVQILVSILGSRKKYNRKLWIRILIWAAYTAADTVAIFAFGIVSNNISEMFEKCGQKGQLFPNIELSTFWAQFLLLHLGGPDSITAYALEDNELWSRQLLELATKAFGAVYVIFLTWTGKGSKVSILSILMFIAGFIKYGERIWVLRTASYEIHRKSVLKQQSPDFDEGITKGYGVTGERENREYRIKSNEGYIVEVELCPEIEMSINLSGFNNNSMFDKQKLVIAFGYLDATKRAFLDASLSSKHRDSSQAVFGYISSEDAFQINEIQLGMIYDLRYTKAPLLHSPTGLVLRLFTISIICSSLVLFSASIDHKDKYQKTDVFITFLLLVVAFLLEIYAILALIFSDRFAFWLIKHNKLSTLQTLNSFPLLQSPRWLNSLSQYALLGRKRKPFLSCGRFLNIGTKKNLEWNTQVTKDLKEVIFRYFKDKAEELATTGNNPFTHALLTTTNQEEEGQQEQDTSINWQEFEYKIIIWSVVTEVFYYLDREHIPPSFLPYCKAIKRISRYMLYLLVQQPSMISAETGLMIVSFEDITDMNFFGSHESKAEFWKNFLNEVINPYRYLANDRQILLFENAVKLLIEFQETAEQERQCLHKLVVVLKAYRRASDAEKLNLYFSEKWERIGNLWLEMLGYAAAKSKGILHAQQLGRGGEFLTHVWLLMVNFGLTHHFVSSRGRPIGRFLAK